MRICFFLIIGALLAGSPLFSMEEGLASWYGGKFQGRKTASGEVFDTAQMTAAHKTLPFGTILLVTNLENGRSTQVRVNDRGPFVEHRIIDLSFAAASALGFASRGVAKVRIEAIGRSEQGGPQVAGRSEAAQSVQVGAFRALQSAQALQDRLAAAGFTARIDDAGAGVYRVMVGPFAPDKAHEERRRLVETGYTGAFVR